MFKYVTDFLLRGDSTVFTSLKIRNMGINFYFTTNCLIDRLTYQLAELLIKYAVNCVKILNAWTAYTS